jgi:MFS family permease
MVVALIGCLLGSLSLSLDNLAGLAVGRLLSGVGIGLAMAVGTTWVVELTVAAGLPAAQGARRASLSLTAGLGVGPAVAGLLAQFGPLPASLPYWVHVAVTLPLLALVVVGTETAGDTVDPGRTRSRTPLLPRAVFDPRFRRRILPTAPWIFGAAGIAYATVPEAVDGRVGHLALLYATILTVTAMAAGFLIQPLAQRLEHPELPRSQSVAMAVTCAGMAFAATTVALQLAWVGGLICAVTLGSALGLTMSSGLQEIQRLADPVELARTTGIFYALAYIGFLAPMLIAISGQTTAALWCLTALAGGCGLFVVAASVRPLGLSPPRRPSASPQ